MASILDQIIFREQYPEPFQYALMKRILTVEGKQYTVYGYPMDSLCSDWPIGNGIYAIGDISGRHLVGKTGSRLGLRERWRNHRYGLRDGVHRNEHIQRSYKEHGESEFIYWVLEFGVPKNELTVREHVWYKALQSDWSLNGWNIIPPEMDGSWSNPAEVKEKIRKKLKGRKRPPNAMEGARKARLGVPFTSEQRARMSEGANARKKTFQLQSPDGSIHSYLGIRPTARILGLNEHSFQDFIRTYPIGSVMKGYIKVEEPHL